VASTLLAALEMARDGKVQIQQSEPFAEIYLRDRSSANDQTTEQTPAQQAGA
jgi:chromatin segregation and condensation protein Rec8/ScpA/Scc1 (kleisin family)